VNNLDENSKKKLKENNKKNIEFLAHRDRE
jgi:hypothetical protein